MRRDEDPYLRERYGLTTPSKHKRWLVPALIVALIGGGWLAWSARYYSNPEVRSTLISFNAVDDGHMKIRYSVHFKSKRSHTCQLVAKDFDANIVGEVSDHFDAKISSESRIVIIPTRVAAVNATIARCAAE